MNDNDYIPIAALNQYSYCSHRFWRMRQLVEISSQLHQQAISIIKIIENLLLTGVIPKPVYRQRCSGCSLYSQCLPQATAKVAKYHEVS